MTTYYVRGSYRSSLKGEMLFVEHIDDLEDLGGIVEGWPDWRALDHILVAPVPTPHVYLTEETTLEYGSDDDARWMIELYYKSGFSHVFGIEELDSFADIYDPEQPFYRMTIRYAYDTGLTLEECDD